MNIMITAEKKYEYKVVFRCDGNLCEFTRHPEDIQSALDLLGACSDDEDARIVRREVGEWEEIPRSSGGEGQCNS